MNTVMVAPSIGQEVEVLAKAKRRRFTLEYKRQILREADRCRKPGELGALLRREGLYSSHLSVWRAARERGKLGGQGTRKRGPEAKPPDPRAWSPGRTAGPGTVRPLSRTRAGVPAGDWAATPRSNRAHPYPAWLPNTAPQKTFFMTPQRAPRIGLQPPTAIWGYPYAIH